MGIIIIVANPLHAHKASYVAVTDPSALHKCTHLILVEIHEVGIIFVPILQMSDLKHREVKGLPQSNTVRKCQNQNSKQGLSNVKDQSSPILGLTTD